MKTLEIAIPTFNRPDEFRLCLHSIIRSARLLPDCQRRRLCIRVLDNSNDHYSDYFRILEWVTNYAKELHIDFKYQRTGFNIGSANNCTLAFLAGEADYKWLVPDDDIIVLGSIGTVFEIIDSMGEFAVLVAAVDYIPFLPYDSRNSKVVDAYPKTLNVIAKPEIQDVMDFSKLIRAQNYVFNMKSKNLYYSFKMHQFSVDEMSPALFLLLSRKLNKKFVFLSSPIAAFRDGDPKSNWRHRWLRLCTVDWYDILNIWVSSGLINRVEQIMLSRFFWSEYERNWFRFDLLFNFYKPSYPYFWELNRIYGSNYRKLVVNIFINFCTALKINFKKLGRRYDKP